MEFYLYSGSWRDIPGIYFESPQQGVRVVGVLYLPNERLPTPSLSLRIHFAVILNGPDAPIEFERSV